MATQLKRVHDAVFQSLAAIARRELGPEQQSQIALGRMRGKEPQSQRGRSSGTLGSPVRHATESPASPRVTWLPWMLETGMGSSSMVSPMRCASCELLSAMECPLLTLVSTKASRTILPAHLAHQNVTTQPSPMNHERGRLQGKAGKAIDIVAMSRFWRHAPSNARETI